MLSLSNIVYYLFTRDTSTGTTSETNENPLFYPFQIPPYALLLFLDFPREYFTIFHGWTFLDFVYL